jgi:hypothetical protein
MGIKEEIHQEAQVGNFHQKGGDNVPPIAFCFQT